MGYALCNLTAFVHINFWCLKSIYKAVIKNILTSLLNFPIEEWDDSQDNTMEPQKPGK